MFIHLMFVTPYTMAGCLKNPRCEPGERIIRGKQLQIVSIFKALSAERVFAHILRIENESATPDQVPF